MPARLLRAGRGHPFQQVPSGDQHAVQGARDRVDHQPGLMGQKNHHQRELRGIRFDVAPNGPEVAGPGNTAWMNQQARRYMRVNRKCQRDDCKQRPPDRIAREKSPGGN